NCYLPLPKPATAEAGGERASTECCLRVGVVSGAFSKVEPERRRRRGARRVSAANQMPSIDTKNEAEEVYTGSRSAALSEVEMSR
ncbi:MAG: hypothetical protein JW913_14910, partial [Chitinispirillaceae bacterium]|nr:hypothetical protein [Chitinispirillaceae bacterium]